MQSDVGKEGYRIIAMFQRLEYLLGWKVQIQCDHRDLVYIFSPEAYKAAA